MIYRNVEHLFIWYNDHIFMMNDNDNIMCKDNYPLSFIKIVINTLK